MMSQRVWTAALLVIGDEILSGRTQDKNVAQVALWLNEQGIRLAEVRVVPDETAWIVERSHADRGDLTLEARIMAPDRRTALRAAHDDLCLPAAGLELMFDEFAGKMLQAIGFDESIDRRSGPRLPLA